MKIVQYVAPVIEPISRAELLTHLKLDSGTFDGNLTLTQSLAYASHEVSAGGVYTHTGTGIDVLGKQAVVQISHGTNGATGTVDTKIQEADALAGPYTDWTGGAFTQVTTANDNADYKLPYTGSKQYIRTASKVLLAACDFGTSVLVNAAVTAEDDALERLRKAARKEVEDLTSRKFLTQALDYYLENWPSSYISGPDQRRPDRIKLPCGNLQTVTSVSWKDTDGTETTLTAGTDYIVETNGEGIGKVVLPYGESWPSGSLYPSSPIKIRYICGWLAAADIPEQIPSAILLAAEDMYFHYNRHDVLGPAIINLIRNYRIPDEF